MRLAAAALTALLAGGAAAHAASVGTPRLDYLLHCSGCHGAAGTGVPERGIPRLKGEVAKLLWTPEGRAYLVQVPGVGNAALSDAEVARLLDWLPRALDPEHLPPQLAAFTADEVRRLRADRKGDVLARRAVVEERLATRGIALRSYARADAVSPR
jgi:mono/diheme cytochrome c family protein